MNKNQIGQLWDSYPEGQRDISKAEFIRRCVDASDPTANGKILAQMVHGKQQVRQGRIQKAQIDAVIGRSK